MSKQFIQTDINKIRSLPELVRLLKEVLISKQSLFLTQNGEELVEIRPAKTVKGKRVTNTGILTKDDPLSKLVGTASSDKPTDASKKYEYLAQAA